MTTYDQLTLDGTSITVVIPSPAPEPDTALGVLVEVHGFDAVEAALGRIRIQMSGPIPQVGERTNDQRTSKGKRSDDVRRFGAKSHAGRMLVCFGNVGPYGYTDAEVTDRIMPASSTRSQWEGCRRRASDLREAGFLLDSGAERDGRIVWTISPQGRKAVQSLINTGWSR